MIIGDFIPVIHIQVMFRNYGPLFYTNFKESSAEDLIKNIKRR